MDFQNTLRQFTADPNIPNFEQFVRSAQRHRTINNDSFFRALSLLSAENLVHKRILKIISDNSQPIMQTTYETSGLPKERGSEVYHDFYEQLTQLYFNVFQQLINSATSLEEIQKDPDIITAFTMIDHPVRSLLGQGMEFIVEHMTSAYDYNPAEDLDQTGFAKIGNWILTLTSDESIYSAHAVDPVLLYELYNGLSLPDSDEIEYYEFDFFDLLHIAAIRNDVFIVERNSYGGGNVERFTSEEGLEEWLRLESAQPAQICGYCAHEISDADLEHCPRCEEPLQGDVW